MASETDLTVAVTGPTGTFGFGLVPLLEADDRVSRVVGIARRPFDPLEHGWTKMEYRRGDVRDRAALRDAFSGADVVVHLAFLIIRGSQGTTQAINVEGTLNAFRAAAEAGARRFVYASSLAAYGFHPDNPVGMSESWPVRGSDHLFYSAEKAEVEHRLEEEASGYPDTAVYVLRPPIVLGPHTVGGKLDLPGPLAWLARALSRRLRRFPLPVPVAVPDVPIQFIHEDDVGRALLQCVVGAGPPGAYNIAADDVLSSVDVARELGLHVLPLPGRPLHVAAGLLARVPALPAFAQWVEAASHPAIMDTARARAELGWAPRFTAREALRSAVG